MNKENEIFWGIGFWAVFLGALFLMNTGVVTWETISYPDQAAAATTAVAVTATVGQTITCTTPSTSTAFGTLSSASISTGATNATTTVSCGNVAGGCTLYVKDSNGALATSTFTIPSPNAAFSASTTLVAGTEGYGISATTTSATGTGAVLTIAGRYLVAGDATGNVVGGATTTNQTIANTTATTSGRFITVTHKAAISDATEAGIYADTVTYECLAT